MSGLAPAFDDPALARPVAGVPGYLAAEISAVTHEQASTLSDVRYRRTHVAVEQADAGGPAASEVPA